MTKPFFWFPLGLIVAAVLSFASAGSGGQPTGGGGLSKVIHDGTCTGDGTSPIPLSCPGTGGISTVVTSAPIQGAGSGGSPVTLTSANYGDVTVSGGTTWSVNALPESRITNLSSDLSARVLTSSLAAIATSGSANDLITGIVAASRMPGLSGDVTSFSGSVSTVLSNGVVTLVKMAPETASTLIGNNTGSPATPSYLTSTQVKSLLAISTSDVSGLAAIATSGSAGDLVTGTVASARMPGLTGDVSSSSGSVSTTLSNGVVTLAKMAPEAASTLIGNNTGSPATPSYLTSTQVKSFLAISTSDVSGLATVATTGSASDLSTGTLPSGQFPALTGDVTTSVGSVATSLTSGVVSLAKMAPETASTLIGNNTGSPATPSYLTSTQVKSLLAISTSDVSGLAAIATSGSASDLTSGTLPAGRFPALTGDVTTSAGSLTSAIASNAVTNTKLAQMAANTVKGNNTGSTANAADLTVAQLIALINTVQGGFGRAGLFGDGSDGSCTMDCSSTCGSTYTISGAGPCTYTPVRSAFFTLLTINSNVTVDQRSWPGPYVQGTLTNNGHMSWDGANASGQTAGAASTATGSLPLGGPGGTGGNANSNGSPANASNQAPRGCSSTSANGGVAPGGAAGNGGTCHGGGGGASGVTNGGSGGVVTVISTNIDDWHRPEVSTTGLVFNGALSFVKMTSSSGGGGGGGGGGVGVGGGGGGGGSWAYIPACHFAGTGTITSNGGNGANGTGASGVNQPGSGGGGGGAGGVIVIRTCDASPPTASNTAGTPGSPGAASGTGTSGTTGGTAGSGPSTVVLN